MQSNYNPLKLIGVIILLAGMHGYAAAQIAPNLLANAIFTQAELNPQQHLNNRSQPELVILDNGMQPSLQNHMWFDREVKVKNISDLRRAGRNSYIEFISLAITSDRKVSTSFKVHCAEGCSQYVHVYELEYDATRNDWQITSNTSFYNRID